MDNVIYKYKLTEDRQYFFEELRGIEFESEWATVRDGVLTIRAGYAWDGCSRKWKVFGHIVGTPDGLKGQTRWASLVHDVFCQYRGELLISKETTLVIFDKMLKEARWFARPVYVFAVDKFGPQDWLLG